MQFTLLVHKDRFCRLPFLGLHTLWPLWFSSLEVMMVDGFKPVEEQSNILMSSSDEKVHVCGSSTDTLLNAHTDVGDEVWLKVGCSSSLGVVWG